MTDFRFTTLRSSEVGPVEHAAMLRLFREGYRDADPSYIDRSLQRLGGVAIVWSGDTPAGFSLGETRLMDLPGLPGTVVGLAGVCCVSRDFRRNHLFGRLAGLAMTSTGPAHAGRRLSCGRVAHPLSFRLMRTSPSVVPKDDVQPTAWQREVGAVVADAYGATHFDPDTFVCRGSGTPVGYPDVEFDAEPWEWKIFEPVNRDRGDVLLAISWVPDAPEGWNAP